MDDTPRQKLHYLIKKYGIELCDDANKLEAMLRDLCPQNKREINLIIGAQKEKVADNLIKSTANTPKEILIARFTQRLYDNLGTAEHFAKWAVETWVFALGSKIPGEHTLSQPIQQHINAPKPSKLVIHHRKKTTAATTLKLSTKLTPMDVKWWQQLDEEWRKLFMKAIENSRHPNRKNLMEINKQELIDIINLKRLDCNTSELHTLEPVTYLKQLQILDCSFNLISSLKPLQSLIRLQEVNCSLNMLINDLVPLQELRDLEQLDCSFTSIHDLTSIVHLKKLRVLNCQETPLGEHARIFFKQDNPQCDLIF